MGFLASGGVDMTDLRGSAEGEDGRGQWKVCLLLDAWGSEDLCVLEGKGGEGGAVASYTSEVATARGCCCCCDSGSFSASDIVVSVKLDDTCALSVVVVFGVDRPYLPAVSWVRQEVTKIQRAQCHFRDVEGGHPLRLPSIVVLHSSGGP